MVTHDPRAATIADRILFLADGLIVRELAGASQHDILEALKEVQALMRRVALKGLAWRKIRGVLTALAIVLGVAMVSGAFIVTDTMKKAADNLEAELLRRHRRHRHRRRGLPRRQQLAEDAVDLAVARRKGRSACRRSAPRWAPSSTRRSSSNDKGEVIGSAAELRGRHRRDAGRRERVNPLTLDSGRWATRADEVAIDAGTAEARASRRRRHRRRRRDAGPCASSRSSASSSGGTSTRSARRLSPRST